MDILEVLNEMEELVEESSKIPILGKILIDDDLLLDMIDHIRAALPEEMRRAKSVAAEREKILEDARVEAQRIVSQAKEELVRMTGEDELVRQARQQATEIIEQAKNIAREIKIGAYQFADEILSNSETNLQNTLNQIKNAREELRTPPKSEQESAASV